MKVSFVVAVMVILCSCNRENLKYDKPYFDFDSLVHTQVLRITVAKASLRKKTFLNDKADSTIIVPDTTQWKHELDAFQQLDVINKPLFKGNYQVKEQEDDHSNLLVRCYSAKIESTVPEVKFFYQNSFKKLKRIEAIFREGNVLYSNSRKLSIEFEEQGGEPIMSRYRVRGLQKMILSDSVKFFIEGTLLYQ